jgi:hypothetical protein
VGGERTIGIHGEDAAGGIDDGAHDFGFFFRA